MSTDERSNMLDELQNLLEMQLNLARQDNSAGEQMDVLGTRTEWLVEKITKAGILNRPEFKNQKEKLKELYEQLHLALSAQKAETAEKLSHLRRGKKIVDTYRGNSGRD